MLFSQRNTGTDPNHIDSDGDLYPDDIELRAGLDPNDDASVPEHVELSLPVPGLGAWGAALLALALVGGFRHLRSTSHRRER
ncbi:MAG: hypothetical protein HRU01_30670 [Myxococcales bacterium]|nr:hypothetical protein [Myxococcales bacterium]